MGRTGEATKTVAFKNDVQRTAVPLPAIQHHKSKHWRLDADVTFEVVPHRKVQVRSQPHRSG